MLEEKLKKIILNKYNSIKSFSEKIDVPYTTIDTILKRGIKKANINNIIKICNELNISVDELEKGNIVIRKQKDKEINIGDNIKVIMLDDMDLDDSDINFLKTYINTRREQMKKEDK